MSLHCTVLIPAYNTEDYIGEAINSVIAQKYKKWDILVVDDGSTDKTVQVVEQFMVDRSISLISYKKNKGAAAATRIGLKAAQGPIITVLDSDDKLMSDSLSTVMPYFESDKKLGFLWTRFICSNGRRGWTTDLPKGCSLWKAMTQKGWWNASHQRFLRKKVYMRSMGLDVSIPSASDMQLALVMGSTGCRTKWVNKVTYWYRVGRKGSISENKRHQKKCADKAVERAKVRFKRFKRFGKAEG